MRRILKIEASTEPPDGPAPSFSDSVAVMAALEASGYAEIDFVGLAKFETRMRDGQIWDLVVLPIDSDIISLIVAYQCLEPALCKPRPAKHWTWLGDGSFEITAWILDDDIVRVRMGEYRDEPFGPTSTSGVELTCEEYRALWINIARAIASAPSETSGERAC